MILRKLIEGDFNRINFLSGSKPISNISCIRLIRFMLSPRYLPVLIYRLSHSLHKLNMNILSKFLSLINFIIFGIEISPRIPIGPGIFFPHTYGTVIGANSIGSNVTIYQQVTLGAKVLDMQFNSHLRPCVGDNVVIGAGAKVLGGIKLENNSIIGANSVVLYDVDANTVCAGVPAKVIKNG